MNIFVCIGLNIHWAKMAPLLKDLKKIGTGVQNDTGNFEDEQVVIVFKINLFFSPSRPLFFFSSTRIFAYWKTVLFILGTLLTTHSPTPVAPHPVTMPTYRAPGTPTYSYVPPQWWSSWQSV